MREVKTNIAARDGGVALSTCADEAHTKLPKFIANAGAKKATGAHEEAVQIIVARATFLQFQCRHSGPYLGASLQNRPLSVKDRGENCQSWSFEVGITTRTPTKISSAKNP